MVGPGRYKHMNKDMAKIHQALGKHDDIVKPLWCFGYLCGVCSCGLVIDISRRKPTSTENLSHVIAFGSPLLALSYLLNADFLIKELNVEDDRVTAMHGYKKLCYLCFLPILNVILFPIKAFAICHDLHMGLLTRP